MRSFCNQAEELTGQVIEDFYHQNPEKIIKRLHSDVAWIGAAGGRCISGRESVSEYIRNIDMSGWEILEKEYGTIVNNDNIYIVSGWIKAAASKESGEILHAVQCITFIWKAENGQFWLLHFHVSNPGMQKQPGSRQQRLIVYGKHDHTHVICNKEIIYIEAENTDSVIHCMHGDILSRESLSDLEKK